MVVEYELNGRTTGKPPPFVAKVLPAVMTSGKFLALLSGAKIMKESAIGLDTPKTPSAKAMRLRGH